MKQSKKPKIRTIIFVSFSVFSIILLALLWLVETVYLNEIYRKIKLTNMKECASTLCRNINSSELQELSERMAVEENVCIEIIDITSRTIASCDVLSDCVIHRTNTENLLDIAAKANENDGEYTEVVFRNDFKNETYNYDDFNGRPPLNDIGMEESVIYCKVVSEESTFAPQRAVFINASIAPLDATVSTLKRLLVIVTGLCIAVSAIVAAILSKAIAKPIDKLNESAKELARGNYGVNFSTDGYRQVSELASTLNTAAKELSKVEEMRRELMANVSHDLRTPLTMITGYSEVMRDIEGENTPENLQVIIDESKRLTELVNDMLDLSKLEAGMNELNKETFNLSDLTEEIIQRLEKMTSKDGYSFKRELAQGVNVVADRSKIAQVIYNLLLNAINYSTENKEIEVKLYVKEGYAITEITDHGEGISKEDLALIWQRYYKAKNHKRPVAGSGLGLSIVKEILELHSSQFKAESQEGKGSTFSFSLKVEEG